jgi:malate dehydrogenase
LSLALDKPANDISTMVIGGHGDTTTDSFNTISFFNGIPYLNFVRRRVAKVAADTMVGGATRQVLLVLQRVRSGASASFH